jgi:hypothetical protein
MSLTQAVVLNVILDLAIVAGLTLVMLTPFRIDRRRPTPAAVLRRPGSADLLAQEDAAA